MPASVAATGRSFDSEDFIGGALCIDFVNSVDSWFAEPLPERLASFADLLSWSAAARTLRESELRAVDRKVSQDAAAAKRTLERAKALRNALHGVLQACAERRTPLRNDLVSLSSGIAAARSQQRLAFANGAFEAAWGGEPADPERLLWPVLLDAEALLLDAGAMGRLSQCPAQNCGWLFLDTSRNRSRRWCSMRTCGNLAKAHRHYARLRRSRSVKERK